jgi:hypothetical protein
MLVGRSPKVTVIDVGDVLASGVGPVDPSGPIGIPESSMAASAPGGSETCSQYPVAAQA